MNVKLEMGLLNLSAFDLQPSFMQSVYKDLLKKEEEILIQILETYLNRTPTINDFKDCTFISKVGFEDTKTLTYKNVMLGNITRFIDFENNKINITFSPNIV
jgi:glutathionylspermidine synthase